MRLRNMQSNNLKEFFETKVRLVKAHHSMIFSDYFKKINSSQNTDNYDPSQMGFNENDNNQILNTPITENETNLAIRNQKYGNSAGLDGIVNEYIKATMQFTLPLYTKLFNTMFDIGILPDSWLEGKIRPTYI